MPVLPAAVLPATGIVDVPTIYSESIYDPALTPDTLEILNGGLDNANYTGGDNTIPAHTWEVGTFARGWYQGFTREERYYARQLGNTQDENQRILMSSMCIRAFIPWHAKVVLFGYQGFCQQDATLWDDDGTPQEERWDIRVLADGNVQTCMYGWFPYSRATGDLASVGTSFTALETRWKWINKMNIVKDQAAGYFTLRCEAWARIYEPDLPKQKLKVPTGGIWILALRGDPP